MPGRALAEIQLSREERAQLVAWARGRKTSQALALRARIVLACARGEGNRDVAATFNVTPQTVGKWRARFVEKRLQGLLDEPRPGAPRRLDDDLAARLVVLAVETSPPPPRLASAWSSRALAARLGVSQSTVSRVWRAAGLPPYPEMLRLSSDPLFDTRVRDVLGLYIAPPLNLLGLGVDEVPVPAPDAPGPQAPDATAGQATDAPAIDFALFAALERAVCAPADEPVGSAGSRTLMEFLRALDAALPPQRLLHVLIDERGRQGRPALARWCARKLRCRVHVAPTCAAWVAHVQRWLALLKARQAHAAGGSAGLVEQALREHVQRWPRQPQFFAWVKPGKTGGGSP